MRLYHCVGARSLRALWAFKELGLQDVHADSDSVGDTASYELVTMPFPPRAAVGEAFLNLNPLGTIPLLQHNDTIITESCAAAVYACEVARAGRPLVYASYEARYGEFLNWTLVAVWIFLDARRGGVAFPRRASRGDRGYRVTLPRRAPREAYSRYHADATLTFPQTLVLRYRKFEPQKGLQQAADDYEKWFHARLRLLDGALADGREFLLDRFTVADICVGYALFLGRDIGIDERYTPRTAAYLDRLVARPAFAAARAEEAASLAAWEAA